MSGMDRPPADDVRALRRQLRGELVRQGMARPRSMREWEIWSASLGERFGLSKPADTDTDEAPGEA